MRKLRFLTVALLGASTMFLTSCEPDEDDPSVVGPTLTVTELFNGIASGKLEVTQGDSVRFQWDARKGSSDLDKFEIERQGTSIAITTDNGNVLPYTLKNADDETYIDSYSFQATTEGTEIYSFIITDKNGKSKTVEIEVVVSPPTIPLSSAQSFTWERVGSNDGTGLAQFGLKWTNNTSTAAIITEDQATRLVELQASEWTSITTQEGLKTAVEVASVITEYDGVSSTAPNKTYNDVLGVRYNDEYYMIRISNSTVTTGGSGTTITITGLYKK